jgi:large subunit ribosomal protein L5
MARLAETYTAEVVPALLKQFGYSSTMAVPRVTKVVVNMGIGDAIQDGKAMDAAVDELAGITGQKPTITRARKSIANFKLREGMAIGRLMNLALPRVRDFRGANPRGFDGRGNYTLGVRDQLIFPEVSYAKVQKVKGMNVCIVTTARTDEEARALLVGLGMPFRKN